MNIEKKALLPPLLLVILLTAVFLTGRPRREGVMDFRAGRWGDSPDEIVRRESSAGFTPSADLQPEGENLLLVFTDMAITTYRCNVVYVFSPPANPGLISGEYRFHDFTNALTKQLTVTLESKYGQAVETSDDFQVYETPRSRIIFDLKAGRLIHEKK